MQKGAKMGVDIASVLFSVVYWPTQLLVCVSGVFSPEIWISLQPDLMLRYKQWVREELPCPSAHMD